MPVPVSVTVWGEGLLLSATVSVAVRVFADAGVKVMERVQLEAAARVVPQLLVWAKSVGLEPSIVMPVMFSGALPEFDSVMVRGGEV